MWLYKIKWKLAYPLVIWIFIGIETLSGQTPNDAIYMPKNTVCLMTAYSKNSWDQYWEGSLKRNNLNIGTNTTESFIFMGAWGISDRLNLIGNIPYIRTKNSAGNLLGQQGIQDLSLHVKYKFFQKEAVTMSLNIGASMPMSNYDPAFLPMSIGIQSKTISGRWIGNYHHKKGMYLTMYGGYTARGSIKIDRDSYQAYNKLYDTDIVPIPNVLDAGVNLGYFKNSIQAMLFTELFHCLNGDDIRRNDMPFPTNKMSLNNIGTYIKYQPKHLGINFRLSYTTNGKNAGQSIGFMSGILYQFSYKKPKTTAI